MTKPWHPREAHPGWTAAAGPGRRRPRRRGSDGRIGARELGLTVTGGIVLGLAWAGWNAWPIAEGGSALIEPIETPDPWAESRRSAEILRSQEHASPPADRAATAAGAEAVQVSGTVRVVDGDTFRHGGQTIRIADIDTPEVRGQCADETRLAARATARMEALLAAGPFEMRPLPDRDADRYGRKLRIVTRDGRSLGDQLVSEGLARTWSGRREPWC